VVERDLEAKLPLKSKFFMWCLLVRKIPTWKVLKKRKIEGPGWCPLWKSNEESQAHLFLLCSFIKKAW
jgi:hypothetical protein